MTYRLTVSPDFPPDRIAGWAVFNTWLQRTLDLHVHLELYGDFESQHNDLRADRIDAIYANPYDAALLVREKGFVPVACPTDKPDEVVVAVAEGHPAHTVEDLKPDSRIVATADPDVQLIGQILLEPAGIKASEVQQSCASYAVVAKALIDGQADVGFFLSEAFDRLSGLTRRQLRPLMRSQIGVIHHALLLGPRLASHADALRAALVAKGEDAKGRELLKDLDLPGWRSMEREEMEFMIDLMDTLEG